MASIERTLAGEYFVVDLDEERERAVDPAILERTGRNARTLIKDGPMRVTLIVLAQGGTIPEHRADGPITVQPLRGRIRLRLGEREVEIGPGELLSVGAGVAHSVDSEAGATFLLTVALEAHRVG